MEITERGDNLDAEYLPTKYKIATVSVLFFMFFVSLQLIVLFLVSLSDTDPIDPLLFVSGFIMLLMIGIMGMMILTLFSFHIDDRIKDSKPYFNDKEGYRHMLLTGSYTVFLITLSILVNHLTPASGRMLVLNITFRIS